ncbi:NADH-quinone oxidoreductase subunit NuoG [Microbulbifer magnicolonia]|uniref:NADH-quinone oxidoreductase subunit NuoG n=1 Tax=Microbulbifer magnicolonia TaxID=3109744 RepID=UPI002B4137E4|nr:NADH-quinone oxidoreductase subunit NuoG [Microbulbifer sp. GG15]
MPTITIDGERYEVDGDQNLLSACLAQGINLPYFCWHPAMGSVGACRQCAVIEYKDADDQRGRLVMSCMTPVKDGGIYSVTAESAREFRGGIIEDLMTNHPHDCPVCEEGGECHLQDMTEMTGHTSRRYRGKKRTHRNQYLGPFINHEMNRCIACYRCTRFYRDYAGGDDLQPLGRNNQVYFGRQRDGMLENGFSGNLVEVCPTGVFTDKTFSQHFVRKWDLQTAPSICEHCAVGCNTAPGAREAGNGRDAILRRVVNLYNRNINGYFLCDRGRFGYDYVNCDARIKKVLAKRRERIISSTAADGDRVHEEIPPRQAVQRLAQRLDEALKGRRRLLGIGSPRSSLENNYALRQLVGAESFYSGLNQRDLELLHLIDRIQCDDRIHSPTTPEIERADAVLILGEDLDNTAPRIALAVRQAARNRQKQQAADLKIPLWQDASVRQLRGDHSPIIFAGTELSGLGDIASATLFESPEQVALFADAIARLIEGADPALITLQGEARELAMRAADLLAAAAQPLIISGCGSRHGDIIRGAGRISAAIAEKSAMPCALYLACPEANSLGITQLCDPQQGALEQLALQLQATGGDDRPVSLLVLENDLYRRADRETLEAIFSRTGEVILLDSLLNDTARRADLIFPAAATAESQGTFVNSNALAQRYYAVYEGVGFIQESWRWLADAAGFCRQKSAAVSMVAGWRHSTDLTEAISREFPQLRDLAELGPDEDYRIDGLKVARQSHRYSGRTAVRAKAWVAESAPHQDPDAPMAFSMEGIQSPGKTPLQANIWSPGWNSNQSIFKFQEGIGGARKGANGGVRLRRHSQRMPDWAMPALASAERTATQSQLQALPLYRLFGSDELSARAAAIASVIDKPFVTLNAHDATAFSIRAGDSVALEINADQFRMEARLSATQPAGTIGVPYGIPQLETLSPLLPGVATLSRPEPEFATESGDDQ